MGIYKGRMRPFFETFRYVIVHCQEREQHEEKTIAE